MKLCLTIGVSTAPPLSYLPGAITVAHEIGDWARRSGFKTEVLTDENDTPVTIARVRDALLSMLDTNDEVEIFILHFAGHGFRSGAEQHSWLPSDWHKEMRSISVEALRRQLYRHGIRSLSIFSDACRSLPTDIDTADICGDLVLPRGPYEAVPPIIDRFNAVVDGQQTYMLKEDGIAPSRCIFSTVLLEGLCGFNDAAFDKYHPDWVIPESLALFSKQRLKEIGEEYDLKLSPDCTTGSPRDHAVYFKRGENSNYLPPPKWPAPPSRNPLQVKSDENLQAGSPHNKSRYFRRHFKESILLRPDLDPLFCNLIVRGSAPKNIWSTTLIEQCSIDSEGGTYRLRKKSNKATQILVEFDGGFFASAVIYPNLITIMVKEEKGEVAWTCISEWARSDEIQKTYFDVIANLQSGSLSAEKVDKIASHLREGKHLNPILGAITSYLYDYTGDVDSIRRMAFFYCYYGQPMPFDVAFMGLLATEDTGRDGFIVEVPPIHARPKSPANDKMPPWVTRETNRESGQVAGMWPWLRQGWEFIEAPEPQGKAVVEGLRDVAKFLLPSQFSSFKEEGASILIRKFHMKGFA